MLNTGERKTEILERADRMKRERARRVSRAVAGLACAAAAVLIIALSAVLSGLPVQSGGSGSVGMAASIFSGNAMLGYLVIGILAFILGVSVTVLCYRLREREEERHDRDR